MRKEHINEDKLRSKIEICQSMNHNQQVVFSTYYDCLTQICFSCNFVRTSLNKKEIQNEKNKD